MRVALAVAERRKSGVRLCQPPIPQSKTIFSRPCLRKISREAAGKLQADGLIHYSRGRIKVPDRAKLEKRVCECYAVVKREYDRLLPYRISSRLDTTT